MHTSTFKMPTITWYVSLFNKMSILFLFELKDTYLHILLVNCYHCVFRFCLAKINLISVLLLGQASPTRAFTSLTKTILFLCQCKSFHIIINLGKILVLIHAKQFSKSAQTFLCSLFVCLGLYINFPSLNFILLSAFLFRTLGIQQICLYLCHLIDALRYSSHLMPLPSTK